MIGRVARRIWAVAMRERYGANERSQKLKYHVQTSGRSLHAQEMEFNDIRTTLQALIAIYDNATRCTPTPTTRRSPRRPRSRCAARMAIQLIINREWGLAKNENPQPGRVHHRRADRPGRGGGAGRVRAASPSAAACSARWRPATSAARSRKSRCSTSTGSTTARCRSSASTRSAIRTATPAAARGRARALDRGREAVPARARSPTSRRGTPRGARRRSRRLQDVVIGGGNVFEVLMDAVRVCSLGRSPTRCSRSAGSTGAACERAATAPD